MHRKIIYTAACWTLMVDAVYGAPIDVEKIMAESTHFSKGQDSLSRVEFRFEGKGGVEKKYILEMAWKYYGGESGFESKSLMILSAPLKNKNVSFMNWTYAKNKAKPGDEWIYLPELRKVRKLGHMHHHKHGEDEDDFSLSDLKEAQLVPRVAGEDILTLLSEEVFEGKEVYIIKATPVKIDDEYPYSETISWVTKQESLLIKRAYYATGGELALTQRIEWQKVAGIFAWRRVVAKNVKTNHESELEVTQLRMNVGLKNSTFTKRLMKAGLGRLRRL